MFLIKIANLKFEYTDLKFNSIITIPKMPCVHRPNLGSGTVCIICDRCKVEFIPLHRVGEPDPIVYEFQDSQLARIRISEWITDFNGVDYIGQLMGRSTLYFASQVPLSTDALIQKLVITSPTHTYKVWWVDSG
jgi:hypothetical protein